MSSVDAVVANCDFLNVRQKPENGSAVVTALPAGTEVVILDVNGGWRLITNGAVEGWVYYKYLV